jgi:hypothetical protein
MALICLYVTVRMKQRLVYTTHLALEVGALSQLADGLLVYGSGQQM